VHVGNDVGTGMVVGTIVGVTSVGVGSLPQDTDATATDTANTIRPVARTRTANKMRRMTGADTERDAIRGTPLRLGIAASCHSSLKPRAGQQGDAYKPRS